MMPENLTPGDHQMRRDELLVFFNTQIDLQRMLATNYVYIGAEPGVAGLVSRITALSNLQLNAAIAIRAQIEGSAIPNLIQWDIATYRSNFALQKELAQALENNNDVLDLVDLNSKVSIPDDLSLDLEIQGPIPTFTDAIPVMAESYAPYYNQQAFVASLGLNSDDTDASFEPSAPDYTQVSPSMSNKSEFNDFSDSAESNVTNYGQQFPATSSSQDSDDGMVPAQPNFSNLDYDNIDFDSFMDTFSGDPLEYLNKEIKFPSETQGKNYLAELTFDVPTSNSQIAPVAQVPLRPMNLGFFDVKAQSKDDSHDAIRTKRKSSTLEDEVMPTKRDISRLATHEHRLKAHDESHDATTHKIRRRPILNEEQKAKEREINKIAARRHRAKQSIAKRELNEKSQSLDTRNQVLRDELKELHFEKKMLTNIIIDMYKQNTDISEVTVRNSMTM